MSIFSKAHQMTDFWNVFTFNANWLLVVCCSMIGQDTKKLCKCLPNSWRYMQSCFGHGMFFMKCEQYLVVPKDAFRVRPSASTLLTACIARNASSDL